jgi:hypothetical protein
VSVTLWGTSGFQTLGGLAAFIQTNGRAGPPSLTECRQGAGASLRIAQCAGSLSYTTTRVAACVIPFDFGFALLGEEKT